MDLDYTTILCAVQGNMEAIERVVYSMDKYIDFLISEARKRSGGWLPCCDDVDLKNHMQNSLRSAIPKFQVRL